MFNLAHSLNHWRSQMRAAGLRSTPLLDELESHLRDEFEQQKNAGLNDESAFARAVEMLGTATQLQTEFQKNHPEHTWMSGQRGFLMIFGSIFVLAAGFALWFPQISPLQRASALAAVATGLLVGLSGRLGSRCFPAIPNPGHRTAVTLSSTTIMSAAWLWTFLHFVPSLDAVPAGQFPAALLWSSCPIWGAFAGIAWGLESAARQADARLRASATADSR